MNNAETTNEIRSLATEVTESVAHGHLSRLDQLFSPDCVFWYNFDPASKKWPEVRQTLQGVRSALQSMHFDQIRITEIQRGWVQQHLLRMVLNDGTEKQVYAVIIFRLNDKGLVCSFEEYLDPAHIAGH
jgi:ketosteroid isomerase-like protein